MKLFSKMEVKKRELQWHPKGQGSSEEQGLLLLLAHLEGDAHHSLLCRWDFEFINWKLMLLLMIKLKAKVYGYLALMEFPTPNTTVRGTHRPVMVTTWIILSTSYAQVSTERCGMVTFC